MSWYSFKLGQTFPNYAEAQAAELQLTQERTRTEAGTWALGREKEAWELQKKSTTATANLTKQFLDQWGVGMADLKGFYEKILSGETGGAAGGVLGDLQSKIMEEYESFKTEYQPMEREFFGQAREELGVRKELVGQMRELARPDYAGVAGRAAADVTGQSEMARQAEQRKMMSMGIDPTSGRFGALTRRSFLDEARNKAISMNLARRGEKERISGITGQALELTDPSKTAGIGLGLQARRTGMLETAASIGKTQADILKTKADIIGGYAENVVRPYGEFGGTLLGYGIGRGGGMGVPSGGYTFPGAPSPAPSPAPGGAGTDGGMRLQPGLAPSGGGGGSTVRALPVGSNLQGTITRSGGMRYLS